ncbi:NUDIX hydrolase [Vulcanibacillus modesticaldus]|uniref:NUDIX hydrolase n=1 Tax=Vulcanibacillus modesticaldus TaxID=337097 RepID=UPI000A03ED08|nr:CoA pyrophosphatase [Vulcanibacillus modesticaldus]
MLSEIKNNLQNRKINILDHEEMNKYAVIVPIVVNDDQSLSILFEIRAKKLRRQPGEVSFPGGKIDKSDLSEKDAAIREASEELGIPKDDIEIIGQLDTYIPSLNSIIYPFVAKINIQQLNPNRDEVDDIFLVPIDYFLQTEPEKHEINIKIEPSDSFPFHLIPGGKNYPWRKRKIYELFYIYNDYIIWGLTAKIVHHFVSIIPK